MADITVTATQVSPLPGAEIEEYNAGGSGDLGDSVYMASDNDVEVADASAAGTAYAIGFVVGISGGKSSFVAGDRLSVLTRGRMKGFSGMTPGDVLYQSDTAGAAADAAGTTSHKLGRARSATVLYVNPPITEA